MKIKGKYIERSAYIWIYSAVAVFVIGFLKWYLAIPAAAAIGVAMYKVFSGESDTSFFVKKKILILGGIIVVCWMILCGQCGMVHQAADWNGRNAQLNDLVSHSWPVYYQNGSAFTYYIGHFLLPALAGKLFGINAARVFLMLYTSAGVYLIWLYMVKIVKADTAAKQMLVLLLLIFFGNMEDIRRIVNDLFIGIFHTSSSGIPYGFTTNSNAFSWAFNQITCAFLVLCIFFDDDTKVENFIVLGVPMLLFSPFMLCGVFVLVAVATVKQIIHYRKNILAFAKKLLSVQNLCIAIVIFPVLLMYLSGNVFAEKPDELSLQYISYSGRISVYIIFVLCEFLLYSICLYPYCKRNVYFYAANAILMILPFFKMGLYNDLVTRASSVGLFVIMILTAEFIFCQTDMKWVRLRKIIICMLIVIVAIPTANGYIGEVKNIASGVASKNYHGGWADEWKSYEGLPERYNAVDLKYGYYTFDAKEHFFFKYMARK